MTASTNTEIDFALRPSSNPVPAGERERLLADPGFGQIFTDNMVTIRWSDDRGWHDGQLEAYGPITLDPATAVFHYAQEIFEGLKAYRQASGPIVAFRPQANAARFNRSARRMAMPELPEAAFVRAIDLLVAPGPGLGSDAGGAQPLPEAVHDRDQPRPRRQQAARPRTCSR